jgi:demethylspheroidene O-methyltransferase
MSGLMDWRAWRQRIIGSAGLRRWVAAFWPTRPIARRAAREVFDLCAGFVYTQVLLATVRLGVLEALVDGPLATNPLAMRLGLSVEATERLLRAGAALKLVERRRGDCWGLGPHGAVVATEPAMQAFIRHHALVYGDLADPERLLRGARDTQLARYWAYATSGIPAELDSPSVGEYTRLMSVTQTLVAEEVIAAYPFRRHRQLMDVGGGNGTFCAAVAAAAPHVRVQVFDLPAVAAAATERFRAAGLSGRASATGGDFFADALPTGADLISFVRVLHDHDDAAVRRLLAKAYAALPPGGRILVAEPLAGTPGAEASGDAYFGFYLLALGQGRPRTWAELAAFLREAGFSRPRLKSTRLPLQVRVIVADRA